MGIIRRTERLEKQVNIKVSEEVYNKYKGVREACTAKGWEFSLQPEFTAWLNGELIKAEKELAKKTPATEAGE
ncbi:MAG: hypothetical protein Q7U56_13265 [Humidesulfovibrio sp.]|jgi:hypothetical protein|nr:hypothetical protein [Humidesulfovibrio sp.]